MSWKKRLRPVIDIIMTISMPVLMAYELAGAALHEYLGIAVFILFVVHHALNFGWIRGIVKGRYSVVRLLNLAVNLLLLVIMFLLPISGIMMSEYIFTFLDFDTGIAMARAIHLLVSYWGFLLMSLHLGLHWSMVLAAVRRFSKAQWLRWLGWLTAAYGVYAIWKRGLPEYLFLRTHFVFFDYEEPVLFFFADYLAIMGLFIFCGYYGSRLLSRRKKPNQKEK